MACIVPFPARRPASKKNDYSFLEAYVHQWMATENAKEAQRNPALDPANPEEEILKLLRRIDRRLSKLAVA